MRARMVDLSSLTRSRRAIVLILVGCLVFGPATVLRPARAVVTLSVAPSLIELDAQGGAIGSQTLTVSNDGDEPIEVTASVESYKGAAGDLSAIEWLTVEPAAFPLAPGEQQIVTVQIALPGGTLDAGGRYAAVAFTTGAKPIAGSDRGSGMAMAGKIAVPFLFQVRGRGDLTRAIDLPKLAPVLAPDGRVGFTALLRNEGNLHVVPQGEVVISEPDGSPYARLDVPRTTAVLPGSEVLLASYGTVPVEQDATYRAEMTVDFGGENPATASIEFAPQLAIDIAGVSICENLDRGPTVRVDVRNDGGLGAAPRVQATVRNELGTQLESAPPTSPVLVWPAETTGLIFDLTERLLSGAYVLAIRVDVTPPDRDGRVAVPPIEREIPFKIGGLGGDAIPLCPPAST